MTVHLVLERLARACGVQPYSDRKLAQYKDAVVAYRQQYGVA